MGRTEVGQHCLLMAYVHIAHDCIIGNHVILANSVNLAGHVTTFKLRAAELRDVQAIVGLIRELAVGFKAAEHDPLPLAWLEQIVQHCIARGDITEAITQGLAAVITLGLGPVGAAFFTWDIGMKKGDIQLLGVTSYAAPLLSTLALVAAGMARPGLPLLAAAVLITGGAAIAARASLRKVRPSKAG